MNNDRLLTIASLLSIVLVSIHVSDDVVRGFEPGGFKNLGGIAIMSAWLCATLLLRARRWGYVILILGSALGALMPMAHMMGKGLSPVAATPGGHLFVWTLFALGVSGTLSLVLSIMGLWGLRKGKVA
jgi:hypothetical protein